MCSVIWLWSRAIAERQLFEEIFMHLFKNMNAVLRHFCVWDCPSLRLLGRGPLPCLRASLFSFPGLLPLHPGVFLYFNCQSPLAILRVTCFLLQHPPSKPYGSYGFCLFCSSLRQPHYPLRITVSKAMSPSPGEPTTPSRLQEPLLSGFFCPSAVVLS